jgi:hypothetical protein
VVRPQIAAMPTTTALVAMIAARMLALRSKRTCLLGTVSLLPSRHQNISNENAGWPIADVELRRTRLAQSEGSEAIPCPARVSGAGRPRLKGRSPGRVSRHRMSLIRRPIPTKQPRPTRRTRGQTDFGDHAPELFESWTQSNRAIKGPCLSPRL